MALEIKKYPDPILRKKCKEIKEISEDIKKSAKDMIDTMVTNQGVGLAGPQIGELKKIIVVRFGDGPRVFINPKIVKKGRAKRLCLFFPLVPLGRGMEVGEEGCLSFPGLFLKIKRAKEIEVEALNIAGEKIRIKAHGVIARIFQHEINHLEGILFIDRVGFWQRIKVKSKLKFQKGNKNAMA